MQRLNICSRNLFSFSVLQPLRWRCVECAIHYERDVREEHPYVARSNNPMIMACNLCWHGASNVWGVRKIFARISPDLPEKTLANFRANVFSWRPFFGWPPKNKVFMWAGARHGESMPRGGTFRGRRHFWWREWIANGLSRMNLKLDLGFRFWLRLYLTHVWPGLFRFKCLSRCPVPVSKMSRNFTSVKFSKLTPAYDALLWNNSVLKGLTLL